MAGIVASATHEVGSYGAPQITTDRKTDSVRCERDQNHVANIGQCRPSQMYLFLFFLLTPYARKQSELSSRLGCDGRERGRGEPGGGLGGTGE